ncbi:hypothetical protein D3C72_740260 [compost metagenome]
MGITRGKEIDDDRQHFQPVRIAGIAFQRCNRVFAVIAVDAELVLPGGDEGSQLFDIA